LLLGAAAGVPQEVLTQSEANVQQDAYFYTCEQGTTPPTISNVSYGGETWQTCEYCMQCTEQDAKEKRLAGPMPNPFPVADSETCHTSEMTMAFFADVCCRASSGCCMAQKTEYLCNSLKHPSCDCLAVTNEVAVARAAKAKEAKASATGKATAKAKEAAKAKEPTNIDEVDMQFEPESEALHPAEDTSTATPVAQETLTQQDDMNKHEEPDSIIDAQMNADVRQPDVVEAQGESKSQTSKKEDKASFKAPQKGDKVAPKAPKNEADKVAPEAPKLAKAKKAKAKKDSKIKLVQEASELQMHAAREYVAAFQHEREEKAKML